MFNNVDEALKALVPFAMDAANPLWETGLLFIAKDGEGKYLVERTGFYYDSVASKETSNSREIEQPISFDPVHQQVYDFLQEHFAETNPGAAWNRLVLEVSGQGHYSTHFELDGEEVYPDAPPEPEVVTADYLCENLRNCLTYNAPANYEWVWEVIQRSRNADGQWEISATFYYSMFEDKREEEPLEPGEYIFMYTVSERLFDEFFAEETKGWSEIMLAFSREGKVTYHVSKTMG
ncbi:MAG: hypothetical protein JWQ27_2140 [Ferruginibacter sp.]|nr:hypothetical protein [Ferruginibacter sp.]